MRERERENERKGEDEEEKWEKIQNREKLSAIGAAENHKRD